VPQAIRPRVCRVARLSCPGRRARRPACLIFSPRRVDGPLSFASFLSLCGWQRAATSQAFRLHLPPISPEGLPAPLVSAIFVPPLAAAWGAQAACPGDYGSRARSRRPWCLEGARLGVRVLERGARGLVAGAACLGILPASAPPEDPRGGGAPAIPKPSRGRGHATVPAPGLAVLLACRPSPGAARRQASSPRPCPNSSWPPRNAPTRLPAPIACQTPPSMPRLGSDALSGLASPAGTVALDKPPLGKYPDSQLHREGCMLCGVTG
jgi:hypothetical protein